MKKVDLKGAKQKKKENRGQKGPVCQVQSRIKTLGATGVELENGVVIPAEREGGGKNRGKLVGRRQPHPEDRQRKKPKRVLGGEITTICVGGVPPKKEMTAPTDQGR